MSEMPSLPLLVIQDTPCSDTYTDQRPGTSGLRKRVQTFTQGSYLQNFVQAIINCICLDKVSLSDPIIVSGDGRYFNQEAAQTICAMLAGNGFKHVIVGLDYLLSTPAVSAIIRNRKATGGIILTASHNPGGPNGDFGVKYNVNNGGAAPDAFTERIFELSIQVVAHYKIAKGLPKVDVGVVGTTDYGGFKVEVVDGPAIHVALLKTIFDFGAIKSFLAKSGFSVLYDGMSGVAGPTARKVLVEELGLPESSLTRAQPLADFGGAHPDPNLTYAPELVQRMGLGPTVPEGHIPDLGAANDGDMDRNMILGNKFFVTPSDSLAVIAAHASHAIPFYSRNQLKGVARSMPTSGAVDRVAKALGIPVYEVPTGWKYFCNLMDSGAIGICGEESFGTGSDHIREKDGMWAVLAWLSIIQYFYSKGGFYSVSEIVDSHWKTFGRNFYTRYDYESVESDRADMVVARLREHVASPTQDMFRPFTIDVADEFRYIDPVDGSVADKQGVRFVFTDGSRIIFRLSGTGSVGATIRVYIERYEANPSLVLQPVEDAVAPLVKIAMALSDIVQITGRTSPTVIT